MSFFLKVIVGIFAQNEVNDEDDNDDEAGGRETTFQSDRVPSSADLELTPIALVTILI